MFDPVTYTPRPAAAAAEPPAFGFVYPYPGWPRTRIRVAPYGFTAPGTESLGPLWSGTIGEVRTLGDGRAVARFTRADGQRLRTAATRLLEGWARNDGWALEIAAGLAAASAPTGVVTHPGRGVCGGCGEGVNTGTACHIGFGSRGWEPTRCHRCGGRLRWWSQAADPGPAQITR